MNDNDNGAARPAIAVFDLFPGAGGVVMLASAGSVARPFLEVRQFAMTKIDDSSDPALTKKALPKPVAPKPKPKTHPGAPATKAQKAALMRADKMVIKRMRKK
jgi:hypothetical protein